MKDLLRDRFNEKPVNVKAAENKNIAMLKQQYFLFIFGVLTFVGLGLIVVVYIADEWAVFEFHTNPDGMVRNLGGTLAGLEYPKRSPFCQNNCASLSLGLWSIYICAKFPVDDENIRPPNVRYTWPENPRAWIWHCEEISYQDKEITKPNNSSHEKKTFTQMFQHIEVSVTEFGLYEYQIETVIGLVSAVLGLVFALIYARSGATIPILGCISCVSLFTSGTVSWIAIANVNTILFSLKALIIILKMSPVRMPTPLSLVVGGIGATIELLSGIMVLVILTFNIKNKEATWCCNNTKEADTFGKESKTRKREIKPKNREMKHRIHQTNNHDNNMM